MVEHFSAIPNAYTRVGSSTNACTIVANWHRILSSNLHTKKVRTFTVIVISCGIRQTFYRQSIPKCYKPLKPLKSAPSLNFELCHIFSIHRERQQFGFINHVPCRVHYPLLFLYMSSARSRMGLEPVDWPI